MARDPDPIDDFIEAMRIFRPYVQAGKYAHFISCEHDIMYIQVNPVQVSAADIARLEDLGFTADLDDLQNFNSNRFGSC